MKTKSLIKIAVVLLLTVLVACLAINGMQVGKYILKPVSSAISLGLDLRGGVSTEYRVTDTSMENYDFLLEGTVAALRNRLTNAGFTEATVAIQGDDRILVEIPDVDDPEEVASIIGTPAHLEFRDPNGEVVFEGKDIEKCSAQWLDETSTRAGVAFELNKEAAQAFEDATAEFIGQAISIYLDDELISAPVVENVIAGGSGVISGDENESTDESVEWANNLAMLIQSGALPLDIEESETRAISATLGIEAIDGALIAGLVGLVIIMLFMLGMYRLPGLAADMALMIYVLIVFYVMAIMGTQLTLQGIAGILLGIGMAVDANVVIFERFREELRDGRTPTNAVKFGFRNAGRAVVDSNVTTLIAAVVLMMFGTGTIKGFATTLLISVLASLFTAVVVTRWLLMLICRLDIRSTAAYTRRFRTTKKRNYTGKTRLCLIASAVVIAAALVLQVAGVGLNLGIDFTGGSLLSYSVGESYDLADVEKILESAGYAGSQITKAAPSDASIALQAELALAAEEQAAADAAAVEAGEAHVHEDGSVHYGEHTEADETAEAEAPLLDLDKSGIADDGMTDLQIRLNLAGSEDEDPASAVRALLEKEMGAKYENFSFVSVDHVSAVAGRDLISNALKALLIAFVCMLIYIAIRFNVFSGLAALFGLAHDVLVMCALMVFCRALFQVNSSFIAAVLTIVGYSINNTIIVFDRIRETAKKPGWSDQPHAEIVSESVGNTLSRTINTSLTTLVTLVALYIFGVESIREFAFPLIVGMLAGTYSSVLLSGQVWAIWMGKRRAKQAKA